MLLARKDLPASTAGEAAELARKQSGKGELMYGTFGRVRAHLAGEMYAEAAGARMTPVPYKAARRW